MMRALLLLFLPLGVYCQIFNPAPYLGMGNTGTAQKGIYSLEKNPAGIASLSSFTAASAYQNHYLGSGVQTVALFIGTPLYSNSLIGVKAISYGIPNIAKLNSFGVAYAKKIGSSFSSSISVNHHRYYIKDHTNEKAFSADLGFQWTVTKELTFGVFYRNITASKFDVYAEQSIPNELLLGLHYNVSSSVAFSCDYAKDFNYVPSSVRVGISYSASEKFYVNGGMSTQPQQYYAGIGLVMLPFRVDFASSFHPYLGTSPQLALLYAVR